MKLIPFNDTNDVKETLTAALDRSDEVEFVIVLELLKDGSQRYSSSTGSQYQKCFMKYFFDASVLSWFKKDSD